jgi:hypothetical protein
MRSKAANGHITRLGGPATDISAITTPQEVWESRMMKLSSKLNSQSVWNRKKGIAGALIFAIASIALLISGHLPNGWWQSFLSNFGAGLYSALLLIFLYDQILERQASQLQRDRNRIAAEQLIAPLRSHIYGTLFPMYRSAIERKPDKNIETWQTFLKSQFPDALPNLDISIRSPGSFPTITLYPQFITDGCKRFSDEIQSWLIKYGAVADSDLIAALERVKSSNFLILGCSLEQVTAFVPPSPFPASFQLVKVFRFGSDQCLEYGERLSVVIDCLERNISRSISTFEDAYWHNECLAIGYARRQMP